MMPSLNDHERLLRHLMVGWALIFLLFLCSCASTVVPAPLVASTASWDGGVLNSGHLGWLPDSSEIVTPHRRDRYNAMILVYSNRFSPAIYLDYGVTLCVISNRTCVIMSPEAQDKGIQMNHWRKLDNAK